MIHILAKTTDIPTSSIYNLHLSTFPIICCYDDIILTSVMVLEISAPVSLLIPNPTLKTGFLCSFGACPGGASYCRPGWPQTHRDLPASAGIKGVHHPHLAPPPFLESHHWQLPGPPRGCLKTMPIWYLRFSFGSSSVIFFLALRSPRGALLIKPGF